jgi:DNA-directed RNA polymerase subunit M/transcription elongation factor TFIIS
MSKCPKCGNKLVQNENYLDCLACSYSKKLYCREPMAEREIYEEAGFYDL